MEFCTSTSCHQMWMTLRFLWHTTAFSQRRATIQLYQVFQVYLVTHATIRPRQLNTGFQVLVDQGKCCFFLSIDVESLG